MAFTAPNHPIFGGVSSNLGWMRTNPHIQPSIVPLGQNDSEVEEEQNEDEEDPLDRDFIDSDYEQIGEAKEIEIDNNMFEENINNPIEEEHEEMGFAGKILDHLENSEDFHSKHGYDESDVDDEVSSKKKRTNIVPNYRQWRRESMLRNPSFDIGMHFPNKSKFKEAVIAS
ncbi:unnamed protein product [Prunus armeniaca]